MNLRRWLLRSLALPLLALGGCPEPKPGVELGRYLVVATRTAGTCGPQQEDGSYSFRVDLTLRPGIIQWAETSGSPTEGTFDQGARAFRVRLEASAQVAPANRAIDFPGCVMVRQDVIDGRFLGPVPEPAAFDATTFVGPSFDGTYSVLWSPSPGSDCSAFIGASSQQFAALPCSTTYRLDGVRQ
ncbi:MAG: hypothetical protein R3A48_23410 [Polyangiales bacterium]